MSMITQYTRLTAAELAELQRLLTDAPFEAFEYVSELDEHDTDGETPRGMDTDKAWAAIEYLLAPLNPPVDVVSGGDPLTEEVWGYDAPRLLSVEEVATAARFLDATPFALLAVHYDPKTLTDGHVYPQIWDEDDALDYLGSFYSDIVAFFHTAAADGESVLIRLS